MTCALTNVLLFDETCSIASKCALRTVGVPDVELSAIVVVRKGELAGIHATCYLNYKTIVCQYL